MGRAAWVRGGLGLGYASVGTDAWFAVVCRARGVVLIREGSPRQECLPASRQIGKRGAEVLVDGLRPTEGQPLTTTWVIQPLGRYSRVTFTTGTH